MALSDNLQAYWKFDESSGNAADATGNGYTLTNNNSIPYVTGKINNGADLERGSTHYFSGSMNTFLNGAAALTVALWVKFESVTALVREPFLTNWSGNQGILFCKDDSNILLLAIGNGSSPTFDSVAWTPSSGVWYHVAVTYDAGAIKFYVNGAQQGADQSSTFTTIQNGALTANIGKRTDNSDLLDGIIDEMGIWTRALSGAEIASLYNSGNGLAYPFATQYDQDVTASVSVTSSVLKQMSKTIIGSTTPSASMVKQMASNLVASATATASMVKEVSKSIIANVSVTADIVAQQVYLVSMAAITNVAASIAKTPGKLINATTEVTASVAKSLSLIRTLVANASVTAGIEKTLNKILIAGTTVSANITKVPGKILQVTTTVASTIESSIAKVIIATANVSATLDAGRAVIMTATTTISAAIVKTPGKLLTAVMSIIAKVSAPFWSQKYPAHGDGEDYDIKYPHE